MPQAVDQPTKQKPKIGKWLLRALGLILLIVLITRLDLEKIWATLQTTNLLLLTLAIAGFIPLILVKTIRWQALLKAQNLQMALWPAFLAYLGSLFLGYLTPGRLGEFVKALHVSRDCNVSIARSFSSVLADRIFDVYALLFVGCFALPRVAVGGPAALILTITLILGTTAAFALFLNDKSFGWFQQRGLKFGKLGHRLFDDDNGLLVEIRRGFGNLTAVRLLGITALTALAYSIYFGQCTLLARSLDLPLGYVPVMFAVGLGSLVALIPVSISGFGTREASIVAYLGTYNIDPESALSFSFLILVTFFFVGGLISAGAWLIRPVNLQELRKLRNQRN
jgi:uncharacterized protein (TIRG00374 family)